MIVIDLFLYQSETEWQQFLRQSLEVVAKVAEMLTAETFQLLVSYEIVCLCLICSDIIQIIYCIAQ